jgi:hypothetical protein
MTFLRYIWRKIQIDNLSTINFPHKTLPFMKDIEKALRELPKIDPSKGFIKQSKNRLLYQIELQKNEAWFLAFLKHFEVIMPSEAFLAQARIRLMERINTVKPSWAWVAFTKRLAASTLVMILAVTATLFFVDGHQIVSAEEATYVEILAGNATVKHADRLIWDEVTNRVDVAAGDLIKVNKNSQAVIHFFDDSQIRLAGNSLLLISKLAVSPAFARQGVIEVFLHEGNAWVQALGVDDGYAGLTLITSDAIAKVINSTFDVRTSLDTPTIFSVFQNKIDLKTLQPDTREIMDTLKVNANNQIKIISDFGSAQKPQVTINPLTSQDKANAWVTDNLQKDQDHLAELRESELLRLRQTAGILPGTMLYPIKQAKERLKLAFAFNESNITDTQIEIANERLNEAILLLQQGDRQKAMESLMAYQSIARQIAEEAKEQQTDQQSVTNRLITPHQKALVASLPTAPIGMVKEALNQTEELLIEDPIELEKTQLENSLESLRDVSLFIEMNDLNSAKETLVNHELTASATLNNIKDVEYKVENEELLAAILELRDEELNLIKTINSAVDNQEGADEQLVALLNNAEQNAQTEIQNTMAFIQPLAPELIKEHKEAAKIDGRIQYFVEKIGIYETWQGQKNQIDRLLKEQGIKANNIAFLQELRGHLDSRMQGYINSKILELQSKDRYLRNKIINQKIDRAIRDRDN